MRRSWLPLLLALILPALPVVAGEEIPGAPQKQPIALVNAVIHTVANGTIPHGTVVFDNGRITAVGDAVTTPANARVIDCAGKHVYPGFITASTILGLSEIDAVRSTRDFSEVGTINPNVRAETAYNPDSEIIPTVRSNGILIANVTPGGGLIAGMASVMRLDGWTREDIAIKPRAAMVMNWPAMDVATGWWVRKSAEEQQKEIDKDFREVYRVFDEARAYSQMAQARVDTNRRDIRMEAMRAVFEDSLPVIVYVTTRRQIEATLDFAKHYGLRLILAGAEDIGLVLPQLQRAGVSVIIPRVHALPRHDEDAYDAPYALPALLARNNIPFAFSEFGAWQQRNLPFHAGTAVAFGLSEADAERSLTLVPARMLGIDASYGSIETGKSATLFVSAGNALDALTNKVEQAFIDGRSVDLSNRHIRLSKKYRERYKQ